MKRTLILIPILLTATAYCQIGLTKIRPPRLGMFNDIKFDSQGNLWLAYGNSNPNSPINNTSTLAMYDGKKWITYTNNPDLYFPVNNLKTLAFSGSTIWLGTDQGLVRKDASGFRSFTLNDYYQSADSINQIYIKNNAIWVASNGGLCRFKNNEWTLWDMSNSNIPTNKLHTVFVDNNNRVWIGSDKGLVLFINNSFSNYTTQNSTLANNNVYTIIQDAYNTVWIGTDTGYKEGYMQSGLYYLEGLKLKHISERTGTCKNETKPSRVSEIVADPKGNIYMLSARCLNPWFCKNMAVYNVNQNKEKMLDFQVLSNRNVNRNDIRRKISISSNNQLAFLGSGNDSIFVLDLNLFAPIKVEPLAVAQNLDVNQVVCPLTSKGEIGWDMGYQTYEVPKGSCQQAGFVSNLWLGGIHDSTIYVAAQQYRQRGSDLYAGPLKVSDGSTDTTVSDQYEKVWKINRYTIAQFITHFQNGSITNGLYQIPNELLTWPAHGDTLNGYPKYLAPFVDYNNDGVYNPYQGDYPKIKGDQALYSIMNDNTLLKSETLSPTMKVEIHVMAYAYTCDQLDFKDSNSILNHTTFFEFNIINRSNLTYKDFYLGLWSDIAIGYDADDYAGCNPKHNYSFGYNKNAVEQYGPWESKPYGISPPSVATVLLKASSSLNGERTKMDRFISYLNDFSLFGSPYWLEHYYRYLNGRWKDDSSLFYGGNGRYGTDTAYHMFPMNNDLLGRPFWSEEGNRPLGDRVNLQSTNMGYFAPGETKSIEYALTYSRVSDTTNWPSALMVKMDEDVMKIKRWYQNKSFPSCLDLTTNEVELSYSPQKPFNQVLVYPNPFQSIVYLRHTTNDSRPLQYKVIDITGRIVLEGTTTNAITFDTIMAGIYFIQVRFDDHSSTFKIVKQ